MSNRLSSSRRSHTLVEPLERRMLMTVVAGGGIKGIQLSDTLGFVPPDTIAAVGPNHVIELTNANIEIFAKATGQIVLKQSLGTFFSSLSPALLQSDPQVSYDDISGRFIIAIADIDSTAQTSSLDFAVSNTSDPTQGFTEMHKINTKESVALLPENAGKTFFSDFPRMGWNADEITFAFNMFTFPLTATSSFDHVQVLSVKKSTALDADNSTFDTFAADRSALSNSTMVPAVMHGAAAGSPMLFLQEKLDATGLPTGSAVRLTAMSNGLTASPTFAEIDISVPAYTVGALGATPPAPQPGGTSVETNDSRVLNVSYRLGQLVASQTVNIGGVARARWYHLNLVKTASHPLPTLVQSGDIVRTSLTTYFPSVEINNFGDIGMTFMESGSTEYLSMYVTGRKWADPIGTMQIPKLVKAGEASYSAFGDTVPYRAGDYSGISVDPVNQSFWAANEYATTKTGLQVLGNWGTWIVNFAVTPPVTVTTTSPTALVRSSIFSVDSILKRQDDELL